MCICGLAVARGRRPPAERHPCRVEETGSLLRRSITIALMAGSLSRHSGHEDLSVLYHMRLKSLDLGIKTVSGPW